MKKKILLLTFLGLFLVNISQAQFQFGGGFLLGLPSGEFAENNSSVGAGVDLNFAAPFAPRVPVYFGLNFGYNSLARRVINETLTAEIKIGNTVIDQLQMPLELTVSNNLIQLHPFLRFKAPLPIVQPYVDVMGGFKYLFTRSKIVDNSNDRFFTRNNPDGDNVISASTSQQDFVLSYGGAVGFQIGKGPIAVDLRAMYLLSGEAEYFTRDDLDAQNVSVSFTGGDAAAYTAATGSGGEGLGSDNLDFGELGQPSKSKTDMLFITLGVVFSF